MTPVDDRKLNCSTGWHTATGSAFYRNTQLRSTQAGARLSLPGFRELRVRAPYCYDVPDVRDDSRDDRC